MAEEQADNEEKGKSSVVKIIMIVVGILLLVLLSGWNIVRDRFF